MANTTNLNLKKPLGTEQALIADINGNMDILDSAIGAPSSASAVSGANAFAKINTLNSNVNKIATAHSFGQYTSLDTFKSDLLSFMQSAPTFESRCIQFVFTQAVAPFKAWSTFTGYAHCIQNGSSSLYFECNVASNNGENVIIGYSNGTWYINELALKSDIKTDSFTGTTSASGNVSKAHSGRVIVLSAWTDGSDRIVTPFPGAGAGLTGQYTWWFQVFSDNSSHSVIANTSVTIYYVYIQME